MTTMNNLGNIRKKSYATEFVVVSNKIAQDNNLSWAEKGMILFLTSLSENWIIHKSNLHNYSSNGIDATRSTFDGLVEKGYIKSRRVSNDKGQFVAWEHIFDIERFGLTESSLTDIGEPEYEETDLGNTDIGFSDNGYANTIKEIEKKETVKKEKEEKSNIALDSEKSQFETFRKSYSGTKRGLDTEFQNFKKHKDWKVVIQTLIENYNNQQSTRSKAKENGQFVPQMPNLQTYINQRRWEEEFVVEAKEQPKINQMPKVQSNKTMAGKIIVRQ